MMKIFLLFILVPPQWILNSLNMNSCTFGAFTYRPGISLESTCALHQSTCDRMVHGVVPFWTSPRRMEEWLDRVFDQA